MKQSVAKLVDVILEKLAEHPEKPPSEGRLRVWLVQQGYKKRDIDAAMKALWLRMNPEPSTASQRQTPVMARQLVPYEALKISSEAQKALARLAQYQLLDGYEFEAVVERLTQMEGEAGLEDLDGILAYVCAGRDIESQQIIYHVIENNRSMLQ